MCDATTAEKYRHLSSLPLHTLSYSDILFLTIHHYCCSKPLPPYKESTHGK